MADLLCPRCGRSVQDLELSRKQKLACPGCGEQLKAAAAGIRALPGLASQRVRPGVANQELLTADLDEISRPIHLRCPECSALYDWKTPLIATTIVEAPSCPRCSAPYPKACHDCGLDLTVDGYGTRLVKQTAQETETPTAWGLFCPNCLDVYDRFALARSEEKPCAQCGKAVVAGELHLRQLNEKVGAGALGWHQTTMAGLCAECAQVVDAGPKSFVSSMAVLFVLIALFALVCFFLG